MLFVSVFFRYSVMCGDFVVLLLMILLYYWFLCCYDQGMLIRGKVCCMQWHNAEGIGRYKHLTD